MQVVHKDHLSLGRGCYAKVAERKRRTAVVAKNNN